MTPSTPEAAQENINTENTTENPIKVGGVSAHMIAKKQEKAMNNLYKNMVKKGMFKPGMTKKKFKSIMKNGNAGALDKYLLDEALV